MVSSKKEPIAGGAVASLNQLSFVSLLPVAIDTADSCPIEGLLLAGPLRHPDNGSTQSHLTGKWRKVLRHELLQISRVVNTPAFYSEGPVFEIRPEGLITRLMVPMTSRSSYRETLSYVLKWAANGFLSYRFHVLLHESSFH